MTIDSKNTGCGETHSKNYAEVSSDTTFSRLKRIQQQTQRACSSAKEKGSLCEFENLFEYSTVQLLFSLAKYRCFKCLWKAWGHFFLLKFGCNISGVCV